MIRRYVDGSKGSDTNDGGEADKAFKTRAVAPLFLKKTRFPGACRRRDAERGGELPGFERRQEAGRVACGHNYYRHLGIADGTRPRRSF